MPTDSDDVVFAGRGPEYRPALLELCTACTWLRGPYEGFDNMCQCDARMWDDSPRPRCGDLGGNVILCMSCLAELVPGCSRWTPYHCPECLARVARLGELASRCVVPLGRYSVMNGVMLHHGDVHVADEQVTSFHDQLAATFRSQTELHELTEQRLRGRLEALGMTNWQVPVDDYLARCLDEGWTAGRGFDDFIHSIGHDVDGSIIEGLL